jgi:hypothetical protein
MEMENLAVTMGVGQIYFRRPDGATEVNELCPSVLVVISI